MDNQALVFFYFVVMGVVLGLNMFKATIVKTICNNSFVFPRGVIAPSKEGLDE